MPRKTAEVLVAPGLNIGFQADIGGLNLMIEQTVDADSSPAEIDRRLDIMATALGRQRAKLQLAEKMLAVQLAEEMLSSLPEEKQIKQRGMLDERVRLIASFRAAHQVSGKRGEYRETPSERQQIANLDANLATLDSQFAARKADLERDIRLVGGQIARLRALVDGEDEKEALLLAAE